MDFSVRTIETNAEGEQHGVHRHVARIALPLATAVELSNVFASNRPALEQAVQDSAAAAPGGESEEEGSG